MKARKLILVILMVLSLGIFAACNAVSVTLSSKTISLEVGETKTLTATASDESAITWSSSNEAIATVSNDGVVTAVAEGTATIKAAVGSVSASCTVTVTKASTTVTISSESETLEIGGSVTLTATASDGTEITWSSSNDGIATVANGVVTAVAEGAATITATAGSASATCAITVNAASGEQIVITNEETTLYVGEKLTLTYTDSYPEDILNFKTSDRTIASVNGSSGVVTGKGIGTVTITATSVYTEKTAEITFTVKMRDVETVTIDEPTEEISLATSLMLKATITPANAEQSVTWKTSNPSIIDINSDGIITVSASGTVTITATSTYDATKSGSITLTAKIKPEEILAQVIDKSPMIYNRMMYWQSMEKSTNPTYDVNGSVLLYYLEPLSIDTTTAAYRFDLRKGDLTIHANNDGTPYVRTADEICLVVVHDAGSAGCAKNTALWGNGSNSSSKVSYGYTVGNDGTFQILDDCYIGWHAGDGITSSRHFILYDTGIPYTKDYTLGISASSGKWTINGVESNVYAATKSYTTSNLMENPALWRASDVLSASTIISSGIVTEMGPNGNLWINNTYYNSGYNALSNCGGGFNGIGIESMVNTADDIYITWQRLAKLVAHLLVTNNLGLERVIYHNSCSGKDCPMTMRKAGEVKRFESLVKAEYLVMTELSDYTWSLETNHPEYVNSYGHITTRPVVDTNIELKIKLTSKTTGEVITYNANTIVKATQNK